MAASMHFGPEWMRNKSSTKSTPSEHLTPLTTAGISTPNGHLSATYSALVSPAGFVEQTKRDTSRPFSYSKDEMLRIYREWGGKNTLGLEVERWTGVVRDLPLEPSGLREITDHERKLFAGPLNSELRRRQSTDHIGLSGPGSTHAERPRANHQSSPGVASPMRERFGAFMGRRRESTDTAPPVMPRRLSLSNQNQTPASPREPGITSPRTASNNNDTWMARRLAFDSATRNSQLEDKRHVNGITAPSKIKEEEDEILLNEAQNPDLPSRSASHSSQHHQHPKPILESHSEPTVDVNKIEWSYLDLQGNVQGPFLGEMMQKWNDSGYFTLDLRVKRTHQDDKYITVAELTALVGNDRLFLSPFSIQGAPAGLGRRVEAAIASHIQLQKHEPASDAFHHPVPTRTLRPSNLESYLAAPSRSSASPSSSYGVPGHRVPSPDIHSHGGHLGQPQFIREPSYTQQRVPSYGSQDPGYPIPKEVFASQPPAPRYGEYQRSHHDPYGNGVAQSHLIHDENRWHDRSQGGYMPNEAHQGQIASMYTNQLHASELQYPQQRREEQFFDHNAHRAQVPLHLQGHGPSQPQNFVNHTESPVQNDGYLQNRYPPIRDDVDRLTGQVNNSIHINEVAPSSHWGEPAVPKQLVNRNVAAEPENTITHPAPTDPWSSVHVPDSVVNHNADAFEQLNGFASESDESSTVPQQQQLPESEPEQPILAEEDTEPETQEKPSASRKSRRKSNAAAKAAATAATLSSSVAPSLPTIPSPPIVVHSTLPPKPAWSTDDEAKKSKAAQIAGLREIQEAEEKRSQAKKAAEREKERTARLAAPPSQEDLSSISLSWGLPTSQAGARASPQDQSALQSTIAVQSIPSATQASTPPPPVWTTAAQSKPKQKTMKEIQEEEERRKKATITKEMANNGGSVAAQRRGYAESTTKNVAAIQVSGGAWTVVGTKQATTPTRPPSNVLSTTALPIVNSPVRPTSNGTPRSALVAKPPPPKPEDSFYTPSQEFLKWLAEALKSLSTSANFDEISSMLLSFPMDPDQSTIEIIQDLIYASSTTLDGRRFAAEFINKRKADAAARKAGNNGKATSIAEVVKTQPKPSQPEWGGFKVVNKKKKNARA